MAYKNLLEKHEYSEFGRRLFELMVETGDDTAHRLAQKLYDKGLVTVNSQSGDKYEFDYDGVERRNNAIESVRKKIQKHLLKGIKTVQAEYINAYCKYFNCSSDWLLSYTDVRTPNIDVRQICEKTGLTEEAIEGIRKVIGNDRKCIRMGCESELFVKICNLMFASFGFRQLMELLGRLDEIYTGYYEPPKYRGNDDALAFVDLTKHYFDPKAKQIDGEYNEFMMWAAEREVERVLQDRSFRLRVARYNLREEFESMINEMYPDIQKRIG